MTLLPEFTENGEKGVTLFFEAGNKNENELIKELENVYPCYSSVNVALKDGKKYIALEIDDEG
ncbi:MAG: hypothetical protein IJS90_00555 [Clostridia bacterium]|nr:hypothetical protein [Clostridia bacterium]